MRSTTDFFGLLAYLTLMYGRLPDRELLNAAYDAADDEPRQLHLTLVEPLPEPPVDEAEHTSVAA